MFEVRTLSRWLVSVVLVVMLSGGWLSGPAGSSELRPGSDAHHVMALAYAPPFLKAFEGLKSGLRKSGYVPGDNIFYDVHSLQRNLATVDSLLKKIKEGECDLVFSITTPVTQALKKSFSANEIRIPVVFSAVADPLGSGIVKDLRHPGGFFTGISHNSLELLPQRLLLFKKAFPGMRRVAIFFDPNNEISRRSFEFSLLHQAADDCHLELVVNKAGSLDELRACCRRLSRKPGQVDGIFMLPDAFSVAHFSELLRLSRNLRIPLMVIDNMLLNQGGVMGYSPDFYAVGVQAAGIVEQIFAGKKPGDIAVQNAEKVKLMVSLKEAEALGLKIDDEVLMLADEVIR